MCSGAWANMRGLPGFAPNPASSRSRVGRPAGATRARSAFFRAEARRPSNLLRNARIRARTPRKSRIGSPMLHRKISLCVATWRPPGIESSADVNIDFIGLIALIAVALRNYVISPIAHQRVCWRDCARNEPISKLRLTFACGLYDRTLALRDGLVQPEGIELNYIASQPP